MTNFVLMVVLNLGYGQKQVLFQEFTTSERCAFGVLEISKLGIDTVEKAVCLQK